LHPETPPEGILLSERFKGHDLTEFRDQLRARGKEFGIDFGNRTLLSNSRLALEASEYARAMDIYDTFHESVFHSYFTEARDIGSIEVIAAIARECDLDETEMRKAIKEGTHTQKLEEARDEALKINLTGVPTFIINDKYKIVGAQPVQVFRNLFNKT
jgi:predicted DsbA family dithiol-disulfide isomerase